MTDGDVIIVGAGVAGCSIARELAPDHDVLVIDREGVAAGATGLSAGVIAPTLFYADVPDAARHANAFFREFDGTGAFSFTERHRIDLMDGGREDEAREQATELADEGFPVRYLDRETVESAYPRFSLDGYDGAVEYDDTGWVDPYSYANALKGDAEERGATFEFGTRVEGVRVEDGAVTGVETDDGVREADHVVVAAGPATPGLLADHLDLPVKAYRTQCVVLEPETELDGAFPIGRLGTEHLYFRPEHNGDLLIGGSHEVVADPGAVSKQADESFKMQVAELVPTLVSGFERAGFVNGWAGVDAATPDARPIIDALGQRPGGSRTSSDAPLGPDGLVVATGFNGLGVMGSPIAGTAGRAAVTGEDAPFPLAPFRLERFESTSSSFDLRTTSEI